MHERWTDRGARLRGDPAEPRSLLHGFGDRLSLRSRRLWHGSAAADHRSSHPGLRGLPGLGRLPQAQAAGSDRSAEGLRAARGLRPRLYWRDDPPASWRMLPLQSHPNGKGFGVFILVLAAVLIWLAFRRAAKPPPQPRPQPSEEC